MITVDIEGGFSDEPEAIAALADELADLGAVGVDLEDGRPGGLADPGAQADRIAAVKDRCPRPFLNARSDSYWLGLDDPLARSLARAERYLAAGADGMFVPGALPASDIRVPAAAIDAPLYVLYLPNRLSAREPDDRGRTVLCGGRIARGSRERRDPLAGGEAREGLSYRVPMLLSMNLNDSSSVPGEDALILPDAWAELVLDRRGRGEPRAVDIDDDAPRRLQDLYAAEKNRLEKLFETMDDEAQETALRAGLAGGSDPFGAAFALAMLARFENNKWEELYRTGLHAWLTAEGAVFATEAVFELLACLLYCHKAHPDPADSIMRFGPGTHCAAVRHCWSALASVREIRSVLAALPDAEYAKAVEAIGKRRSVSDSCRLVSAVLMPDQEAWVREACTLLSGDYCPETAPNILWAFVSNREHLKLSKVRNLEPSLTGPEALALLVDALGTDALAVLADSLEGENRPSAETRDLIYEAISLLPTDEAIHYLIGRLTQPQAVKTLRAVAERFPVRTLRAVGSIAPTLHSYAKARIVGMVRGAGLDARLSELDGESRVRVTDLLESAQRVPVAESLPEVFAAPPWAPFKNTAAKLTVDGLTPPAVDELRWAPQEREDWRTAPDMWYASYWQSEHAWTRIMPNGLDPEHPYFPELLAWADDDKAAKALDLWDGSTKWAHPPTVRAILARFGEPAAARILEIVRKRPKYRSAMAPFVSLEVARLAADWVSRSRKDRPLGRAWLDRHAAVAADLLIPDALGKTAKLRRPAADALRHLAATDRKLLDERAAAYGGTAAAAVGALVDADPCDPMRRVPKPPAWADPQMLPPVLLRGGAAALPADAVGTLISAIALDDPERLYPGADLLAAECDPASLTAFSWSLFELWTASGSPSKDAWAMDQLRRFADDGTVRRLAALVREWPGQSQHTKAVRGLEVLGLIGTEDALRSVQSIAANVKFKALKKTAAAQIEVIAERLDLTLDQLADRLVPDFGLSSDEPLVLDYGPRSFTVRFDESLKPFLVDDKGKRRASAPKPSAKDDSEAAQAAYERFAVLRKELKATAAEQVKRLEAAMTAGRTWSYEEFRRYFVDQPVMWQLTSRLVLQASTENGWRSLRLAEDRTLADVDDEPIEVEPDAAIRIAHPLALGAELDGWSAVLADYEILQPFEQLTRPVFTLTEEETATGRLTRFEGAKVPAGALVGMLKRGWVFGPPQPGSHVQGVHWEFPEGGWLMIRSAPGFHPGYGDDGEQTLEEIEVSLPESGTVDPVRLSEALNTVARLSHSS